MAEHQRILLKILLLTALSGALVEGLKLDVVTLLQERIQQSNKTANSIIDTCQCTCGQHQYQNGTTLPPGNSSRSGSCGCGCGCCMTCSQFRENIRLVSKRSKKVRTAELSIPIFEICSALYKLYDDYVVASDLQHSVDFLKLEGYQSDSPEMTTATHHFANAWNVYKTSWIEAAVSRGQNTDSNGTINAYCVTDGECSQYTWKKGCATCIPDLNLLPTCPPAPLTTSGPGVTATPKPLNLSLCICPRVLIPPLKALEAALDEVNIKIQDTMTELWECRFRQDALERARDLALALEELIVEMNNIVAQIDSYTETRSSRRKALQMAGLKKSAASMQTQSTRQSAGFANCEDRGQSPVEQAEALQWSIRLFLVSPTNQEVQHSLNCWTFLVTTVMFKILSGKITLEDADLATVKGIISDMPNELLMVEETIKYLFEWNDAREVTLKLNLEKLQTEVDEILDQMVDTA